MTILTNFTPVLEYFWVQRRTNRLKGPGGLCGSGNSVLSSNFQGFGQVFRFSLPGPSDFRSTMKDKAMDAKELQQDKSPLITPAAFYTKEKDKTKFNWFLFEFAAEFDSHIKRSLRKKLNRKNITNRKIAELCVFYAKQMKGEILYKLSGRIENVSLSYHTIAEFFPNLNDKLVDDLLTSAFNAWDSITSMCVSCPTRCISEKDRKAPMFDDPFYYE